MNFERVVGVLWMLMLLLLPATHTMAQGFRWPEEPENLKALPSSVKGRELGALMRGFTNALGVRCQYCHSGKAGRKLDPMDLMTFDLASDANPMKEKARAMITMTRAISEDHLANFGGTTSVTCVTCHRGQAQPRMLEDVLSETLAEAGVEAAVEQYRKLRRESYGGFSYNFEPGVLGGLGERLLGEGKTEEAVRILELELEHNPEFAYGHYLAATGYDRAGDKQRAIEHMEKAVSLATPAQGKDFFQSALEELRAKP